MNQDQFMGVVRAAVAMLAGWLVGHGYQSAADAELFSGFALSAAPLLWTYFAHSDAALIASAARVPDVAQIVTTPEKASANPSSKVVAS